MPPKKASSASPGKKSPPKKAASASPARASGTTADSELRDAVERAFSDDFLFDSVNRAWRSIVVDDDGAPQPVDATMLASFTSIATKCSGIPAEMVKQIAEAVKASKTVAADVSEGDSPTPKVSLRRKKPLLADADPDLRTVFVKPVHYDATDDQIKAFFSTWGKVVAVERRQYLAGSAGTERARPSTFVVFATQAEARKCIAAKPSYGTCNTDLGNLFVPKLVVQMKEAHEAAQSSLIQRAAANAQTQMAVAAATAATPASAHLDTSSKFLRPNCTVHATGLAKAATWQDIKAKLGNLALSFPELKKKIGVVHVEACEAYITCKTPEAAQALLVAYASADKANADMAKELKALVPHAALLQGDAEQAYMRQYPDIVAPKANKKVQLNQKRSRD